MLLHLLYTCLVCVSSSSCSISFSLLLDDLFVHGIDLGLVNLGSLVALEFESWGERVIVNGERNIIQVDTLRFLKT